MSCRPGRTLFVIAAIALAFIAGSVHRLCIADAQPAAAPKERAEGTTLYELRIYTAAPGKMDALNKRFRDHTLRLFEKHGIKSIGYWTAIDDKHQGRLYYIVAYPNLQSREKMLINGIAKDPEFAKAVAESEVNGKLTAEIESVLLAATDYSPMK